ncbi:MAG TPA: hypothetical protein PKK06_05075 [Phycisphaerae bacterium]|nr:hypothetical protein [Phycisphaerae bacterium]
MAANLQLECWKDNNGARLCFTRGSKTFEFDIGYEAMGKFISAIDDYISNEPDGVYKKLFFEVEDE